MKGETLAVYVVVDLDHAGAHPQALVAAVLRGGATIVQIRHKQDSASGVVQLCTDVSGLLAQAGVPLILNDRLDLALAVGAAGVHLGQRDMRPELARALARRAGRSDLIIGLSVSTVQQAAVAAAAGVDYLSVSPVFNTPTKIDTEPAAGLAGVHAIRRAHPQLPIVGIGGINVTLAPQVIRAGADGVAFISAARAGGAPEAAVRAMAAAVKGAKEEPAEKGALS